MDNGFLEIIHEIKNINSYSENLSYSIGKIKTVLPNIIVEAYGIMLDKDDLILNSQVKDMMKDDALQKGDKVLLLPLEEKFIILCKVVSL